jgi:hypothetical protein
VKVVLTIFEVWSSKIRFRDAPQMECRTIGLFDDVFWRTSQEFDIKTPDHRHLEPVCERRHFLCPIGGVAGQGSRREKGALLALQSRKLS